MPNVIHSFVWDIYQVGYVLGIFYRKSYFSMIDVGLFVPNQNNNRCPQTGALLAFEGLLEIKE